MLFAEGDVSLAQTGGSAGGETITASSLLFNTATLEGVFDNGRAVQTSSDAINLPSGSTLIVASEVFGRDSGGTISFKSGELTFCDDENPHWRIKATRIWLLPGGEFAFLNARLFVGHFPLLYLPAFYIRRTSFFLTRLLVSVNGKDITSTQRLTYMEEKAPGFSVLPTLIPNSIHQARALLPMTIKSTFSAL